MKNLEMPPKGNRQNTDHHSRQTLRVLWVSSPTTPRPATKELSLWLDLVTSFSLNAHMLHQHSHHRIICIIWQSYFTRFQFYLLMNGVTDLEMNWAMFFSLCGRETFSMAQAILAPEQITEMTFDTIMGLSHPILPSGMSSI